MPLLMMWWCLWGSFNKPEHIFVPLLLCIFFHWPYVNANDATNIYLYLKYMMWFLLTWMACEMRTWLSLFYDFLLCHCEWGIHICQTWQYLHAIAILQFPPAHVSGNFAWHKISSSQLYHVRICNHDYHCLCFMIFLFWFQVSHFQMFSWILLSTLRLQLGCTQGGHVSAKKFWLFDSGSTVAFFPPLSTVTSKNILCSYVL